MKDYDLSPIWKDRFKVLDVAFQPILNIQSGTTFAVEALLRNVQKAGFQSIFDFFDALYNDGILYKFDIFLRQKAIEKFVQIPFSDKIKLFYNLDNRLLEMDNFEQGNTKKILKKFGMKKESICFEISERHELRNSSSFENLIDHYQNENYHIAIDDFGVGYAGYKLLYDTTPNYIKIDRFFLQDIQKIYKKRVLVQNIVHLAAQLGINVIAEGVETKKDLLLCKEIGCHYVQGYFVQKPTTDVSKLQSQYEHIRDIVLDDQRFKKNQKIFHVVEKIDPINIHTKMNGVLHYFKKHEFIDKVVPVVNNLNEPVGVLLENSMRQYLYSPYGYSLLTKRDKEKSKLKHIVTPCASADINTSLSSIIEIFTNNKSSYGIIMTQEGKYYGFLSAQKIINIIHEENLLLARDQNPLTKLPGNYMIQSFLENIVNSKESYIVVYFDLNNFKAFNDVYGFRLGDRIIQLFADIMKTKLDANYFKAHIGGDDFFCGVKIERSFEEIIARVQKIVALFSSYAQDFYSKEDKKRGYIVTKDREGKTKQFPLVTVCTGILEVPFHAKYKKNHDIQTVLASLKKSAKTSKNSISIATLL